MPRWLDRWPWPWRRSSPSVAIRVRGRVARPGPCATRVDGTLWSMQLTLSSWEIVGGVPQEGPLHLVGEGDDEALRTLQARCPEGAVVVADIALHSSSAPWATLVAIVGVS